MKRTLAMALLGVAAVTSAYGQGAITFHNYAALYVPIVDALSNPIGPTSGVQIEVWAGAGNVTAESLTFLANAQWSAFDGYLSKTAVYTIPASQYVAGSTWTFQLRASGTLGGDPVDSVASRGPLVVTSNIGNLGGSPPETPKFNYTPGFTVTTIVPEPSTFALAGLGAAALLIFRRRD